jgi:phosphatidyl-myo-inositol dimannoside synthase
MLSVARLVPHKGQDVAIKVLAALENEFPQLHYVMVGKGDDEPRLRTLAETLRVADRVHFVGQLDDEGLADAYATSTVYVGLSRLDNEINVEGFGISFVEAGASGIPVVAGDSGGVRAAVRDGETGFVVDPGDVSAATAAIGSILRDDTLRSRLGSAGRAAVESHYNWDRVAVETREFVHECVGLLRG